MADLFENIAPSWVTDHLYQLGDVVLYNKKLYQCTDKHTSSSDIDLDKFKPHTLADMVAGTTQLENFADMTVVSDVVTSDETYTYLEMPNNGVVSDKTKIATLNSNLEPKLLWTNPNPTAGFDSGKIAIDLTNYKGVIIEFRGTTATSWVGTRLFIKKSDTLIQPQGSAIFGGGWATANVSTTRQITAIDNTGVTIGWNISGTTKYDTTNIPYKIYGVTFDL